MTLDPLQKLDAYLDTYTNEPDDGMSDLTGAGNPDADMTFGDLRALRAEIERLHGIEFLHRGCAD